MQIERIATANMLLGAPEGWDAEKEGCEVVGLPAYRHEGGFVSQWRPTLEELEAMLNGAPIWLHVLGDGHPPVSVTVAPISVPAEEYIDAPA